MPPEPGLVSDTCAVTPSNRSWRVSRNPVFIASAITSVATPAATPITEKAVTKRKTAGRYGDRRYRLATNHSNRIEKEEYVTRCWLRKRRFRWIQAEAAETESRRGLMPSP